MRRTCIALFALAFAAGAQNLPIRIGDPINLAPPGSSADGRAVVFAAAAGPDARPQKGANLYLYTQGAAAGAVRQLTYYAGDSNYTGVTSVTYGGAGGFAAFTVLPTGQAGVEEVHLMNLGTTVDRTLVTDKEGCIQPLCVSCFRACVGPVHLNADATRVVYAAARQQPFYSVNADGSGLTRLPVYSGAMAPSPQRVISRNGLLVLVSAAPSGPTFAAAATDVYVLHLDGTGLEKVTRFGDPDFYAANATLSADGTLIAFESNFSPSGPQSVPQIWIVRSDGSGLRRLSTGSAIASNPSISGDGSVVTFLQSGQIKRVLTSGDPAELALTGLSTSTPRDPVVSEDGTQVAFTLGPLFGGSAAVARISSTTTTQLRAFTSVYAPRFLSENGVASATGYGSPSPGSLITAYGYNLAFDELTQARSFPLPAALGEVSLAVNGQQVPLVAVTPWQINAQLPQTLGAGPQTAQVQYTGGTSLPIVGFTAKAVSPANFSFAFTRGNLFYQQAAAFHAGTVVAADLDHPAAAGEILEVYGAGLGRTDPLVPAGLASPSPPARASQTPRVRIGGREATVVFAGLTPGLAGVYQVNVIVPSGLTSGVQSLAWLDGENFTINSSIAIR